MHNIEPDQVSGVFSGPSLPYSRLIQLAPPRQQRVEGLWSNKPARHSAGKEVEISTRQDNALIQGLLKPDIYRHETHSIRLIETHCAWVVLTGLYAYKIKKPVNFGFLDFSTLEKRKFYSAAAFILSIRIIIIIDLPSVY